MNSNIQENPTKLKLSKSTFGNTEKGLNRLAKLLVFSIFTMPAIATAVPSQSAASGEAAEVTGELEVLHFDDFKHNKGEIRYFVHDKQQNKRFQLKFQGDAPKGASTGAFVRVRGQAQDEQIYLATNAPGSFEPLATTANAVVSGDKKTIVLVADFNDASVPCTTQEIEKTVFTDPNQQSVNDLYRETSLNKMQFTGMVAGPFTINYSSTDACDVYAFAQAADNQAQTNGIDLSQYAHKVYVLPKQNSCGWYGSGTIGGSPSKSWITQCDMTDVYAHELGHNLGMGHSGTPTTTYSDTSDIMGLSGIGLRQINGPHQEQMGWRETQQIVEINVDGTYNIAPLELNTTNAASAQIFKIRKPDTAEWYYLSYRQRVGFDASLSNTYLNGLNIHRHTGDGSSSKTIWVDTLADSESFSDPVNGFTITQVTHNENLVSVEVTLPHICTRNAPTVSITPQSQTGTAGSVFSYGLTVTNNDTAYCPNSTWTLGTGIPADWFNGLSASGITIAPGQSATVNWQVTSSGTAADGDYTLTLGLTDAYAATHNGSIVVNYTVATPGDTQPPTAPTALSALAQRRSISVSWQQSTDNKVVAGYRIFRNGIQITTTATTSYSDSDVASGQVYAYYAEAFDADNNLSAPSNSSSVVYGSTSIKGGGKNR